VTHNMQQAGRVSDTTAFFLYGWIDRVWQNKINIHQTGKTKIT
jgi:ABC-type phosphate transport system ATPase subunit